MGFYFKLEFAGLYFADKKYSKGSDLNPFDKSLGSIKKSSISDMKIFIIKIKYYLKYPNRMYIKHNKQKTYSISERLHSLNFSISAPSASFLAK